VWLRVADLTVDCVFEMWDETLPSTPPFWRMEINEGRGQQVSLIFKEKRSTLTVLVFCRP
jgi:hypothetical protein